MKHCSDCGSKSMAGGSGSPKPRSSYGSTAATAPTKPSNGVPKGMKLTKKGSYR